MALYEYRCQECGTKFELRRSMRASDDPAQCPTCAGSQVTRQVSLFMSLPRSADNVRAEGSGCGCGGACSCGGHNLN